MTQDLALRMRVQQALADEEIASKARRYSIDELLNKLCELAERTRARSDPSLEVEPADVAEVLGDRTNPEAFFDVGLRANLLIRTSEAKIAFRDRLERDALAAGHLVKYLTGDYQDRGTIRDRAVDALQRIGGPAVPELVRAIGSSEGAVRLGASVALCGIGMSAVPALLQALEYGNAEVRRWAAQSLAAAAPAKAAHDQLENLLKKDEAPLVRAAAALALKTSGTPRAVEALVSALQDTEPLVLSIVRDALREIDTPLARRALDVDRSAPKRAPAPQVKSIFDEKSPDTSHPPRIFLSYPHEHAEHVDRVRELLGAAGFDVWMDSQHLLAGQKWEQRLTEVLDSSDFAVAFISSHTADGFQLKELQLAGAKMHSEQHAAFLLPCIVDAQVWSGRPNTLPEFLRDYHFINLTNLEAGWPLLYESLSQAARSSGLKVPIYLRSEPNRELKPSKVSRMLIQRNFYDAYQNTEGRAPYMDFGGLELLDEGSLVEDVATGLIWTRNCFEPTGDLTDRWARKRAAQQFVYTANQNRLGGFSNWRVPTIEEAMSLMTPHVRLGGLHIAEAFSDDRYVMTSDGFVSTTPAEIMSWVACYGSGDCQPAPVDSPTTARLVRSGWRATTP
jgi:hypothetical protein